MNTVLDVIHVAAIVMWLSTGGWWVYTGWRYQRSKDLAIGGLWFAVVSVAVSAWTPR